MLSEVIHSEHSYSAVPLAGQQTDQRFVHFGPLVAYIPLSLGAQTISSPRSHERRVLAYYLHIPAFIIEYESFLEIYKSVVSDELTQQVVTGSNLTFGKVRLSSSFSW